METIFEKPLDKQVSENTDHIAKDIITYTYSYTISANGDLSISAGQMGMDNPPAGYFPVAITFYNTGNIAVFARGVNAMEVITSNNCIWLHNVSNANASGTMSLSILYLKF